MKLVHARLRAPNFGDELSPWLFSRLAPGLFDGDESTLVLGVGSIISARWDGPARKVVLGAGYVAQYARPPAADDGSWDFRFVRGQATCRALGLDPDLAVGDAAILVREVMAPAPAAVRRDGPVSFMPHWESLEWGYWAAACAMAGVELIDPRWSVERCLGAIAGSRLILAEAMHGAIVADALRTPFVPLLPLEPRHRAKWADWAGAAGIDLAPAPLRPSSPTELIPRLTRRLGALRAGRPGLLSHEARLDGARARMARSVAQFVAEMR